MTEFNVIFSRSFNLLIMAVYLVFFVGIFRGEYTIKDYFALQTSRDILAKTVSDLEKETNTIKMEIEKIELSKNYARKILKDKYHITDTNEKIIFFAY